MKERIISAGLALAALGLFWALLFPKVSSPNDVAPLPLSSEATGPGYLALKRWLAVEGIPVLAFRGRFDWRALAAGAAARTGNLMITTMPHAVPIRLAERERLDEWVRQGNTLLVMAALADTPRWSAGASGEELEEQLEHVAHAKVQIIEPDKPDLAGKLRSAVQSTLAASGVQVKPIQTAAGPHALFAAVTALETRSDLPASRWQAAPADSTPLLTLARRADNDDAAVWMRAFGAGTIILSAFASPIANEALGEADNARWLANIVAYSVRPGGRVIIDDAHSGAVDFYDPKAFFADPRLHHTLWWIVFLWFLFAVGAWHLREADTGRPPVDDVAMLRLTAGFYASALSASAAGTRLFEHFFNSIRRRRSLREDGSPDWDWLEQHARLPRAAFAELQQFHDRVSAGQPVDVARLNTLLNEMSGHLA